MKRAVFHLVMALLIISPLLVGMGGAIIPVHGSGPSAPGTLEDALAIASPETQSCINCHLDYTPGIVYDWLGSKHAWHKPADVAALYEAIGYENYTIAEKFQNYNYTVGCYECHGMFKEQDRPDIAENHFGFQIVTIVTLKDCSQCHIKEAEEISWTMHAFAALNAPIKPWYAKVLKYAKQHNMTDEFVTTVYENTGSGIVDWPWYKEYMSKVLAVASGEVENDTLVATLGTPYDQDFKEIVSPLYPASGVLAHTGIMYNESFRNAYVYEGCLECHGSAVVPYKKTDQKVFYWGWPSNGAGRIDPDGSLGACTACHTRHSFSLEEVRHPYTCGQCHLGYDHPHIEIYEESKHGNIYDAEGDTWNWSAIPWKVGVDFRAPTCATCHMSTIADPEGNIVVKGTHDLRARLVWDQLHFFTYPKPKWADFTANAIVKGGSQLTGAGLVENGIVPTGWKWQTSRYPESGEFGFPRFVKVKYTGELKEKRQEMMKICQLCHSPQWVENFFTFADQNLYEYNITAHYAYSLLQKAYELGIHNKTNKIDEYMEIMWYYIWHHDGRRWRNGATMAGPDFTHWFGIVDTVMDKLGRMVAYYDVAVQIKNLEAQIAELQQQGAPAEEIQQLQNQLQQLQSRLNAMEAEIGTLSQNISSVKAQVETLDETVQDVSGTVSDLQGTVDNLNQKVSGLEEDVQNVKQSLDDVKSTAEEAVNKAGKASTALAVGVIGLIIALIAVGLAFKKPTV